MAKKAVKTRVHHLAKKIGVESKDIVAKCKSEGIPGITTYQSAISAGLQATIVEWFSEVEDKASSSAIETAAKVDVTKVKARAKKENKKESSNDSRFASRKCFWYCFSRRSKRCEARGYTLGSYDGRASKSKNGWAAGYSNRTA